MNIHFLGTNGWYTTPTGNTPCVLIDSHDHYVIFDAGNGLYKIDEYIKEEKPISLFISHFHIDHISGLHTLAKFSFPQGIDIFMGKGRKKDFEEFVRPPYTIGFMPDEKNINNLSTPIRLNEVEEQQSFPFPIACQKLYHAYTDHGYRIELEGKTIAYSGDTGIGEHSYTLFNNVDVLIHECSWKTKQEDNGWGHIDPLSVAELAKDSGVKQLILTHFDASQYTNLVIRDEAEEKAKTIFQNTIAAKDGMIITL
jgi:ribonuclease BN (tRNA processing enzyme)